MNNGSNPWTEELIERMLSMWAKGESAAKIAATFGPGFTKNSIVGKIHRIQAKSGAPREARPRSAGVPKVRVKPAKVPTELSGASSMMTPMPEKPAEKAVQPLAAPKKIEPAFIEPPSAGINIMDPALSMLHCRAPMWSGDHNLRRGGVESIMFCGKKVRTGSSYCEEHFRKMVSAVIPTKRIR